MSAEPLGTGCEVLEELHNLPGNYMVIAMYHRRIEVLVEHATLTPPGRSILRNTEEVVVLHSGKCRTEVRNAAIGIGGEVSSLST